MTSKRTYGDRCGVARALDLVGERWALLVVRELLLGPKRFTDLRAGLPHVGPDVLAQRLRDLEQSGLVRRGTLPPPAGSRIYELTERGRELEPVVIALGRFGSVAPFPPGEAGIGVDAVVIALKSLFAPAAADGMAASYELRLGEQRFRLDVADGRIEIARGSAPAPDATLETDPGTLASVLWHGRKLDEARRAGDLAIAGDRTAVTRLLALFPLPTS
ncbi:MAG TPA: winged helix-turn-helix transcriptional regulator [Solirubrobacteraceae bacterium]|jgi:DNA-binding HxlR family transcriptional regulator